MAYQTLYRKYRPDSFERVYGQNAIVRTLKNVIKNNKLSHAYLFTGPRGTGKTSCAKLFAKTINCLNNENGDACNECENCKSFINNNNPDIIEMDAASNNGVDEIREIKNKINLVPSYSKYKVYIIDEVHMLSIGAFNALLKTLEEPPEYVIFILATTEPQKIPITVISRCQRFDFKSISKPEMKKCLQNIVEKEQINIDDDALDEIINNSKGGMRDAIGMLDQAFAFCEDKITITDVEELSGDISNKEMLEMLNKIIEGDYKSVFEKINQLYLNGKDFSLITEKMINLINKGIIYKKTGLVSFLEEERNLFDKLSDTKLYKIIEQLADTSVKLQKSYQKDVTFEVQIIQLMDKLNNFSNVPRETLEKKSDEIKKENIEEKKITDTKEDTTKKEELYKKIQELKNLRINNILMESTKKDITFINDLWSNISEFLIDAKLKLISGVLLQGKPVASSQKGIIITFPSNILQERAEKSYDDARELILKIYNNKYKIVFLTEQEWLEMRPLYVQKMKNKELELKDEKLVLAEINNIRKDNSFSEFDELIETEE